jgi:hypothetical protein
MDRCSRCDNVTSLATTLSTKSWGNGSFTITLCFKCIVECKIKVSCNSCPEKVAPISSCPCKKFSCTLHQSACGCCTSCSIEYECMGCHKCTHGISDNHCDGCGVTTSIDHIHQRFRITGCKSSSVAKNYCCKCTTVMSTYLSSGPQIHTKLDTHKMCSCGEEHCVDDTEWTCKNCRAMSKKLITYHGDVELCCACHKNYVSCPLCPGTHLNTYKCACKLCNKNAHKLYHLSCPPMKRDLCCSCVHSRQPHLALSSFPKELFNLCISYLRPSDYLPIYKDITASCYGCGKIVCQNHRTRTKKTKWWCFACK